jgi:hypothetical protein
MPNMNLQHAVSSNIFQVDRSIIHLCNGCNDVFQLAYSDKKK